MADIFISYASEDRSRVEPLAKALEDQGCSVWWDPQIPPGKTFFGVIKEALEALLAKPSEIATIGQMATSFTSIMT